MHQLHLHSRQQTGSGLQRSIRMTIQPSMLIVEYNQILNLGWMLWAEQQIICQCRFSIIQVRIVLRDWRQLFWGLWWGFTSHPRCFISSKTTDHLGLSSRGQGVNLLWDTAPNHHHLNYWGHISQGVSGGWITWEGISKLHWSCCHEHKQLQCTLFDNGRPKVDVDGLLYSSLKASIFSVQNVKMNIVKRKSFLL